MIFGLILGQKFGLVCPNILKFSTYKAWISSSPLLWAVFRVFYLLWLPLIRFTRFGSQRHPVVLVAVLESWYLFHLLPASAPPKKSLTAPAPYKKAQLRVPNTDYFLFILNWFNPVKRLVLVLSSSIINWLNSVLRSGSLDI